MKRPDVVWFNGVNLSGLWFKKPHLGRWNDKLASWWDKSGDFNVEKLGTDDKFGVTTFASEERAAVQAWTDGVLAAMTHLQRWSRP